MTFPRFATLILALGLLTPTSVGALQVEQTRTQLCAKADAVVVAEVTSFETVWAEGDDGALLTRIWFARTLSVRGDTGNSAIELVLPGGAKGGIEHRVEDTPKKPQLDRRYLLFLAGGPNGAYKVLGGEAGVIALNDAQFGDGERYIDALASVASCKQ